MSGNKITIHGDNFEIDISHDQPTGLGLRGITLRVKAANDTAYVECVADSLHVDPSVTITKEGKPILVDMRNKKQEEKCPNCGASVPTRNHHMGTGTNYWGGCGRGGAFSASDTNESDTLKARRKKIKGPLK